MSDEEKEFIIKVNVDKANNKSIIAMGLLAVSIATYILPLLVGQFDFGIVFEVISLLFIIIAKGNMKKYEVEKAKRNAIIAMIPIGWICIFDLIIYLDVILAGNFDGLLTVGALAMMFSVVMDLGKADNPEKYKEKNKNSKNWFYEDYDGENKGE